VDKAAESDADPTVAPTPVAIGGLSQKASGVSSPLRIIASFIGLSQALAVTGAAATDGTSRLILTGFAVIFPLVVLGVFLWLLVRHPANLYAPSEYTSSTSVETFAAALDRRQRAFEVVLAQAVPEALLLAGINEPPEARDLVAEALDSALRERAVTVHVDQFTSEPPARIPVTEQTTVQDLLDQTYFILEPAVDVFTYGRSWVLERENGERLDSLFSGEPRPDGRSLAEAGIEAGDVLRAVRV
jgi:hypothetical protein